MWTARRDLTRQRRQVDSGSASAGGGTAISVWVDAARVPASDALKKLYLPQLGLAATVQMVPVLIVFVAVQRYLVRGVTVGAVKA